MRDPERIPWFTNRLANLWMKYFPDWRFGQFMSNFYSYYGQDFFYLEEEVWMEKFEEFVYHACENPNRLDFIYYDEFINKE